VSVVVDPGRQTVLVTGGAGFIGAAACRSLRSHGHVVVAYDDLSRGRREMLPDDVRMVVGDIRDAARLEEAWAAAQPHCVVHLAAMHFIPDCSARPGETMDVNVEGTRRVLERCRAGSVKHVIFASTAAVYAPTDDACVEDTTPLGPLEVYGESKLQGERLLDAFHAETGISTTTLRLFNGIGRDETNPHVVPHIFESLRTTDAIRLGNIAPRRDYIDTRDIGEAITSVVGRSSGHQVFNVGTGIAYAVRDITDRLERILGRALTVVQDASRLRAVERTVLAADISRIRNATGWSPRLSLDDTLWDLVAAYGLHAQPRFSPATVASPEAASIPRSRG
jgi:UDP-glucose 4-epimerase